MKTQISRFFAIALFLLFSWSGFTGWWNQWSHCSSVYEEIQSIAQLLFGVLSIPIIVLLILKRPLPSILERAFTAAFVVAGSMAPVVWGKQTVLIGIAAGAVTILFALGTLWLAHHGTPGPTSRGSP
jgi:hypothetical protein